MEDPLRSGADDPGLTLIETLGRHGADLPRLPLHLARLAASAARLGWPCDAATAERRLRDAPGPDPARLRLTLDRFGTVGVAAQPLPAAKAAWRLGLAARRLDPADPWLRVKSSRRAAYDAARAALPDGLDEAVLLNVRGEVCDGTITTLFFDRGEGLRTPPLECGLLPGVLRAAMLADGACREETLEAADLASVRLWAGNSLRGLIPAVWAGPRG